MITLGDNKAIVAENGTITLPEQVRQTAGFVAGDELLLVWLPPDTLILRKLSEVVADDETFAAAMREFDQALQSAGYETDEDVLRLVQEVKQEQISEWTQG
jgi:bifunctional DNA-binding transcriptional regulator/antitoxin component of YhaV-PrlF toxin-antitoxin module